MDEIRTQRCVAHFYCTVLLAAAMTKTGFRLVLPAKGRLVCEDSKKRTEMFLQKFGDSIVTRALASEFDKPNALEIRNRYSSPKPRQLLFLPNASLSPIRLDSRIRYWLCCETSGSSVSLEGVANAAEFTGIDGCEMKTARPIDYKKSSVTSWPLNPQATTSNGTMPLRSFACEL